MQPPRVMDIFHCKICGELAIVTSVVNNKIATAYHIKEDSKYILRGENHIPRHTIEFNDYMQKLWG